MVQDLLGAGADVRRGDRRGWTALHFAAWKGHLGELASGPCSILRAASDEAVFSPRSKRMFARKKLKKKKREQIREISQMFSYTSSNARI